MSPGKKLITAIVLTLILCASVRAATLPDSVRAVKVSGGEEHTVVLTAAKTVWACDHERV
jgi:alpha-tubulin suppressor-like RCC1 family protein